MFRGLSDRRLSRWVWLCLAALVVGGASVRFYALDRQSLWFDEICSWHTGAYSSLHDVVFADRYWNMYPPAYGLITHFVITVAGDSEWVLRAPSALAGVLAIPLMFLVGLRLFGAVEGLIAAGFSAFLVFPVYYGQEARPYALLFLATLAAVLAWTYVIGAWKESQPAPGWAIVLYFIAATSCNYLHYFGLLFTFFTGAVTFLILSRSPGYLLQALGLYVLLAVGFAPWLPSMWQHLRNESTGPQNPPVDANVFRAFYDWLAAAFDHGQLGTTVSNVITCIALLLLAWLLVNTIAPLFRSATSTEAKRATVQNALLPMAWLLLPFLFAYTKSVYSASIFTHRNLIVSLPAIYLLMARALTSLPIPTRAKTAVGTIAVIAAFLRLATSEYYSAPHKDQFREAVSYMVQHEGQYPGATLIVLSHQPFTYDYYLQRLGSSLKPALVAGRGDSINQVENLLDERTPPYVWYLCTDPYPENAFVDYLNRRFHVVDVRRFLRVDVFLLAPKEG